MIILSNLREKIYREFTPERAYHSWIKIMIQSNLDIFDKSKYIH